MMTVSDKSTFACEEIDTSFDQVVQKLPMLLFKESNSRIIIFIKIFFLMNL